MSWKITLNKLSLTSISKRLAHLFPDLKKNLWIARINKTPEEYTKEKLRLALMSIKN